ncbi:unnamed protein product, partial [Sphacelaria rigidula]
GDRSAVSPGGVRVGTPALTTRGMKEAEFRKIADFMDKAAQIALRIQKTSGKMLKDFVIAIEEDADVKALGDEVVAFAQQWPMPGFESSELKFKAMDH